MALAHESVTSAASVRAAFGPAVAHAAVEESACAAFAHIDPVAMRAVGEAMSLVSSPPRIISVAGYRDVEDPGWWQILLRIDSPGQPGSDAWRASLASAGAVIECAVERHPEAARLIASQVSFDV